MFSHLIAVLIALAWSIRYQLTLGIRIGECGRYWLKSMNLALCYRGFADSSRLSTLLGAGKAAFLCCAYDVVTDWRDFEPALYKTFERILIALVTPEEADLALDLYNQEKLSLLSDDGLSRGPIALAFITRIMGTESQIRLKTDFSHFGIVMQIVDDVLDLEEDRLEGEMNCLLTPRKEHYLKILRQFRLEEMKACFPNGQVLWKVVALAKHKGYQLSVTQGLHVALKPFPKIDDNPYQNIA